jgi:hypothetical protein
MHNLPLLEVVNKDANTLASEIPTSAVTVIQEKLLVKAPHVPHQWQLLVQQGGR